MNCPKCGAVAAAGAEECPACGIVFSRWRERPQRPSLSSTPLPPAEPQRIPTVFIVVGAIVFVLFGIIWTARRHAAAASQKNNLDSTLDEINNKGEAERERLRNEAAKADAAAAHDRAVAAKAAQSIPFPSTITEAEVRSLIEQNALFQDIVTVSVPKVFEANNYGNVTKQYPAFLAAKNEALIEFDPPFEPGKHSVEGPVQVKVPPTAYYKAMIRDRGDTWEIDVGKRKLDALTVVTADDFKLTVRFTITYEQAVGNVLHPDGNQQHGEALLTRGPSGWRVDSVAKA